MTGKCNSSEDWDTVAAEYALRLLTGDDLSKAKARAKADPDFAAAVARWRGRLAPFDAETADVTPPTGLWDRIQVAVSGRSASNDNVADLRRRLNLWRSATGAMGALAASLVLFLAFQPRPAAEPPAQVRQPEVTPLVAMLGDKSAVKVVASWYPRARQLVLAVPGEMPTDTRHARELWVIPVGGKPSSLGTMPAGKQMHMRLADALAELLQHGATIAISIEPPGGSPSGTPTGPVVASGTLTRA
jgi:anti-sigma-K factor RskA